MRALIVFLVCTSQVAWGAKPNYSYHVKIDDPQQANFQEKAETRLLENAQGFYSVLEPNGALRTVTYTADERGFIPVVSYSYGHPVKKEVVVAAPVKVLAQPVRQQVIHQAQPQYIRPIPQRVVSAAVPLTQTLVSAAAPLGKTFVSTAAAPVTLAHGGPVGIGGYSYGVSSADDYALSYGTPGFSYTATRKFSHPVAAAVAVAHAPVQLAAVQLAAVQPAIQPVLVQKQIVQKQVVQEAPVVPVQTYGPPDHQAPPVISHYVPQYAQKYVPQPQYIQQQVVHHHQPQILAPAAPVIRQLHTVQPAQVALPAPQSLHIQQTAAVIPAAVPLQIPQIAYGAPTFNYRAPEIRVQPQVQTVSYAPQHVQYAPAPVLKQVQLAQPQIQLTQLSQAQVNYVAPQPANIPLTTEVRIPAPAVLPQPLPVVQKQVLSAGNGLQITGNALAVPAANGLKNPLTFAYSYGSGASRVSHSYSGSGW